jgi:DNA-binding MarR family transcriptional regulator
MPKRRRANSAHQVETLDALRQFRVIYGSMRQHFRQIEKSCGVSGSQLWILQEVAGSEGIGVSQLAVRLSIHQSTCSQLVEKLVGRGLLKKSRQPADQRRVGLIISKSGQRAIANAPGPAQGILTEALGALSGTALKSLRSSLAKVIAELDLRDDAAAEKPLADL